MTVALSDGTVAKSGGKVIKNVAGLRPGQAVHRLLRHAGGDPAGCRCACTRCPGDRHRRRALATTRARWPAAAAALSHARLELQCLDVRWEAGAGAVLARVGRRGVAPRPREHVSGLLDAEGLEASVEDDDGALWDAQREAQRSGVRRGGAGLGPAGPRPRRCWSWPGRLGARVVGRAGLRPVVGHAVRSDAASASRRCARRCRPRPAPCSTPRPVRATWTSGARATRARVMLMRARQGALRPRRGVRPGTARDGRAAATAHPDRHVGRRQPARAGADRRLRALRLLPAHLPHLRAVGRGGRLAARADRADEARATRRARELSAPMVRPLRQLPGLHGLRDRLPVGRAVRQADRGHTRAGRAQLGARRRRPLVRAGWSSRCSPTRDRLRALAPLMRLGAAHRPRSPGAPRCRSAGWPRWPGWPLARARRITRCPSTSRASGESRGTVALLQGCVQRVFFGG